jgi:hypothetical protein
MADTYTTIGTTGLKKKLHDNADSDATYSDVIYNAALGATTDTAASSDVAEDATARTGIGLLKGIKNVLLAGIRIGSVTVCPLTKGAQVREKVTCTNADTDYAAAGAAPAGTKTIEIGASALCYVAMGANTSATVGRPAGPSATSFPFTVTGTAADDTVHVQSPTAGTIVSISYIPS